MKAVLINPYVPLECIYGRAFAQAGAVMPPLGILYLAAYLKNRNKHNVEILDANVLGMGCLEVVRYISRNKFECAGFSATGLSYPYAVEIAKLIRRDYPSIKLVIGGSCVQSSYRDILAEYPALFDFLCCGEGEYSFELLLDYLSGELPEEELTGWSYIRDGRIFTTPPADIPENLDVFGHPAEVVPAEYIRLYHEKILAYKRLPIFSVITSRGCPFQCTFCSTPRKFASLYEGKMRYHSIKWICEELKLLKDRYGIREVSFVDDTFNLCKSRVMDFCEAVVENNLSLHWTCNFKANIADMEMMKKMKQAGCWGIMVGAESGSERILKFIKKAVTLEQLRCAGEMADSIGIVSRVSFILGFPLDTVQTIEETINFAKKSSFHFPYFQLYVPFAGTEMFDQLSEYGKTINGDKKKISASKVNYIPKGLTEEFLLDAFHRAHRIVYFRWKMIKNHLKFIRSLADLRRYWIGLKLLLCKR